MPASGESRVSVTEGANLPFAGAEGQTGLSGRGSMRFVDFTTLRERETYRSDGGTVLISAAKRACSAASTGRCLTLVLAGSLPRKLSPFQLRAGLIGRATNPPPQFGQTFCNTLSTQAAQNVHS